MIEKKVDCTLEGPYVRKVRRGPWEGGGGCIDPTYFFVKLKGSSVNLWCSLHRAVCVFCVKNFGVTQERVNFIYWRDICNVCM